MRIAIIGSGPAGLACAKALVRRGLKPTLIDVGEILPADRQAAVDRMAGLAPAEWSAQDREFITQIPSVLGGGVPKKMVFGSNFHFAHHRNFNPTDAEEGLPAATFARGGYSVAWGAAVLPTHENDLDDWPIRTADLAPSYRRVLSDFPLSAARDDLEAAFPLFKDDIVSLPLPDDARSLLSDFARGAPADADAPFLSGQARLAVDAGCCRHCGLCLSGCVYGAIHSMAPEIETLRKTGAVRYESGCFVERLNEDDAGVRLCVRRIETGEIDEQHFDFVFLAAGAIQTTRIVLASLQLLDQPVTMKDSQKFILPLLRLRRFPLAWPNSHALSNIFVEFQVPDISHHWVHAQISSVNDYVLQSLRIPPWTNTLWRRMLAPFYERLLVAWCGLHSDHSSSIILTLKSNAHGRAPTLQLRRSINPDAERIARRASRFLARRALRARTWAVTGALTVGAPGAGNHFGGTLPMRAQPKLRLEADVLGRLPGWQRIHIVDGSILPSIPATTVALLQMANADRIAAAADLH